MLLLLFSLVALPASASAHLALYRGTLEVVKTSGALCGSNDRKTYPIDVVLRNDAGGIEGYFTGQDVSTGRFKGTDAGHLEVAYPFDDAAFAEGHTLSLQPSFVAGELREKHLAATAQHCNFDSALLKLQRVTERDAEAAWEGSAARWEVELLNRRTVGLIESARYGEAVDAARRSLALSERHFGPDSAATSVPLSNLAVLYRTLGRHSEAEPLCKRVLASAEKDLGPEHPTVAIRLINLAELYEATGRHAQAEPLYRRALEIYENAFGPEHPDVAKVLNNLAVLQVALGRHRDAEPLYLRAIAIMEKTFGPGHPSVATLRRNLAEVRKKLGPLV